jgi:hypothetical protein
LTKYSTEWRSNVEYEISCLWCYSESSSTPGKLKSLPDHLWDTSHWLYQLSYEVKSVRVGDIHYNFLSRQKIVYTTAVRQPFQLARCGCTLRVTPQTSYSPEYTTPTHTKSMKYHIQRYDVVGVGIRLLNVEARPKRICLFAGWKETTSKLIWRRNVNENGHKRFWNILTCLW